MHEIQYIMDLLREPLFYLQNKAELDKLAWMIGVEQQDKEVSNDRAA